MSELSVNVQKIIESGRHWDEDRTARLATWAKVGWAVAGVLLVLFLVASTAAFVIWMKLSKPVAPDVLAVDHATGQVQVLELFNHKGISDMELVHKLFAKEYVEHRERYIPQQINDDYAATLDMSEGQAKADYAKVFAGPNARHLVLKDSQTWTIDVLSVQLPPDASHIAIVRYKKTIWEGGAPVGSGIFVARFSYRFGNNPAGTERKKISNPLDYKVSSYITDAEVDASKIPSPMTPATPAPGVQSTGG